MRIWRLLDNDLAQNPMAADRLPGELAERTLERCRELAVRAVAAPSAVRARAGAAEPTVGRPGVTV